METQKPMTDEEAKRILAASALMCLREWPDDLLATFNLGVLLYGRIPKESNAFERAVSEKLCKEDGYLWDRDALEMAAGAEISRRGWQGGAR